MKKECDVKDSNNNNFVGKNIKFKLVTLLNNPDIEDDARCTGYMGTYWTFSKKPIYKVIYSTTLLITKYNTVDYYSTVYKACVFKDVKTGVRYAGEKQNFSEYMYITKRLERDDVWYVFTMNDRIDDFDSYFKSYLGTLQYSSYEGEIHFRW